ncbi:MAG: hypothetical protein HOF75_04275 [Flavobacteriaceae bacterium]|jgi:hypothetical protein|nr:hypothetical protein [Flavobacteriaceae bacterium]MBT3919133.1 hypothetical protein [Flavobacteriaceae bacterium]MBT6705239.1 hypothetical protein [Flavobacteriaceae bacterium]MBT7243317.1 hypothetical protein [Flavobacteriaceae bacterium]
MRKLFFISILLSLFSSCNDGDIIITDFNFEASNLNNCGGPGAYIFYNINNSLFAESISLVLETSDILFLESGTVEYVLNGITYAVNYRKYDDDITDDYFCSNIPPTTPNVTIEFLGASGIALLTTIVTKNDEDGIEEDPESNLDTDNDGLLNYFDNDDDGDNVPTLNELGSEFLAGNDEFPLDNDKDGVPDYLDTDDDGDTILTRYEDANGDLDPTNDFTDTSNDPDYLTAAIANSNAIDQYRIHSYQITSDIELVINNLVLVNGSEEITKETMILGNKSGVIDGTISLTPNFN